MMRGGILGRGGHAILKLQAGYLVVEIEAPASLLIPALFSSCYDAQMDAVSPSVELIQVYTCLLSYTKK